MKKNLCILLFLALLASAKADPIDSLFAANVAKEQLTDSTDQQRFDYHFYRGIRFVESGKLDSAYAHFVACCQLNPKVAEPYFQISKICQFSHLRDSALVYLNHAIARDPKNAYYREISAAYCISQQKYAEAAKIFEALLKKDADNETYIYRLIELYNALAKPQKVLALLDKLEQYKGISEEISLTKIDVLIEQNQPKRVVDEFNKLIKKYPAERRYPILLGDYFMLIGKTQEGLDCYYSALEKDSTNGFAKMSLYQYFDKIGDAQKAEFYLNEGLLDSSIDLSLKLDFLKKHVATLTSEGENKKAEQFFAELFRIHPNEIEIYKFYVAYLVHQERFTDAIDNLKTMLIIEPDNKDIWDDLIDLEVKIAPENAVATVQSSLEIFPRNLTFYYVEASLFFAFEQAENALAVCDKAVEIATEDKDLQMKGLFFIAKAEYFAKEEAYSQAFENYEKAVECLPDYTMLLNNYAYLLSVCNHNLKQAEQMSSKAVKAEPQNATYLDTYAWILFMRGEYFSAKFYIEKALNADDEVIFDHYGDILFHLGEKEKAVENWKKSQEKGNQSAILKQKIETQTYIPDIKTL